MKCPICEKDFQIPNESLEEFYYDCSHCGSSLLLKEGKCQVLSEGTPPASSNQEEEFFPNETTQVPELNQIEDKIEEAEDNFYEETNLSSPQQPSEELPLESQVKQASLKADLQTDSQSDNTKDKLLGKEDQDSSLKEISIESSVKPSPKEENAQAQTEEGSNPHSEKKEDFADVAEFGNAQDQQETFLYNLTLSEINSQNTREKVLFILTDSMLNLPINDKDKPLEDCIENGKITLTKVSPVKAYIIVTSLMGLPLKISWKQHHITDN